MPLLPWLASLACSTPCSDGFARASDGMCYAISQDSDQDTGGVTEGPVYIPDLPYGDAIEVFRSSGFNQGFYEIMDASNYSDTEIVMSGQGGALLVDRETGTVSEFWEGPRVLKVDAYEGQAVAAGAQQAMLLPGFYPFPGGHFDRAEDIAIYGDLIAIAAREQGVVLFDSQATFIGTFPATDAWSVELQGSRALVVDDRELALWELSDPQNPELLDRIGLVASGRDISWVGDTVAVAVGGRGAQLLHVDGDSLGKAGRVEVPGSALNLSLEPNQEWLWIASWETMSLAYLGGDEPVVVGHEPPAQSAMAVIAEQGRAFVGDWMTLTTLDRTGMASGELHMPELHAGDYWLVSPKESSFRLDVYNDGALPMEVDVVLPDGLSGGLDETLLPPRTRTTLRIEGDLLSAGSFEVVSNDPDETLTLVQVSSNPDGVGAAHPDIELQGFVWPDADTQLYRSQDEQGQVIFLAYWLSW